MRTAITIYKDIFPFNILDLDATKVCLPELVTKPSTKCIVFYKEPIVVRCKNKILIPPLCGYGLIVGDIIEIENLMIKFAQKEKVKITDDNAFHIIKTVKNYVYHAFCII